MAEKRYLAFDQSERDRIVRYLKRVLGRTWVTVNPEDRVMSFVEQSAATCVVLHLVTEDCNLLAVTFKEVVV